MMPKLRFHFAFGKIPERHILYPYWCIWYFLAMLDEVQMVATLKGGDQGGDHKVGCCHAHALTLYWIDVGGAEIRRYPEAAIGPKHTGIGAVERRAGSKRYQQEPGKAPVHLPAGLLNEARRPIKAARDYNIELPESGRLLL